MVRSICPLLLEFTINFWLAQILNKLVNVISINMTSFNYIATFMIELISILNHYIYIVHYFNPLFTMNSRFHFIIGFL